MTKNRFLLIQIFRAGLWLPVIQTILWVAGGVRDGDFVEWATGELGPRGDNTALLVLAGMFAVLALLPVLIAASDARPVRIAVFVISIALVLFATKDWIGYQSPLPYQLLLKALHTPLALLGCWIAWSWMREGAEDSPHRSPGSAR
ncbi:MAG: hypothetical protein QM708_10935 [Propioniciclava sp.]|uniref:hypothetical protein n=1 Tax=Propioniciclava sp. TaxID=2038686 RepID=UPI0039E36DE9